MKMNRCGPSTGALFLTFLLLTSCGFFSRTKSTFYALEPLPAQGPVAAASGTPIGIEGVELPPGVDRREIVVRGADHKLEIRGTQQWSAPLEDMVIHTLAFNLAKRLPEGMVVLPGQDKPAAMRSVYVIFEDLTAGPENVFTLDARWTTAGRSSHERITIDLASLDSADIAAAMNQALATLADRITGRPATNSGSTATEQPHRSGTRRGRAAA
jgi:uncharacterized lipoprotein YmbA